MLLSARYTIFQIKKTQHQKANGLVPIVEPEVLMDGDHPIERTAEVMEVVYAAVYKALSDNNVLLEGSLLKPAMCCAGQDHKPASTPEEVGKYTVMVLSRHVPPAVPGVMV
jgi:fructose-bisphosphate aldolase class I